MSDIDTILEHAEGAGVKRAYKAGAVPPKPSHPYVVLALSRLAPDTRTLDGSGNVPRRLSAQMFGKTHESVSDLADLVLSAFDAEFVDGFEAQFRVEVTTPPYRDADDNGVLNVTQTYRF